MAVGAVGVSIWRDRANAVENGIRDARNIAIVLGGQIARSIQSVDIVLRGVQRRIDDRNAGGVAGAMDSDSLGAFRKGLLQQLAMLPQAFQIVLTDGKGQLVVSTAAWPTPDINFADREYFRDLAGNDDDRLSISLPVGSRFSGDPVIVLARRINGPDRAFLGAISVSVKRSYFESTYRAVDALPNQSFSLMRPDGTVVIRYPDTEERGGQKLPVSWPFHAVVRNGGGSYRSIGAFDPVVRWVAVNPLKDYPLVVNVLTTEQAMLRDWTAHTYVTIAGTIAFLCCALILLWVMARQYRNLSASEASLADKSQALESEHRQLLRSQAELQDKEADLRRHKTELQAQNQRLDAALNNMSQGLAMFDHNERLVVCNERYREIHRLSRDQVKPGTSLVEHLTHRHRQCGFPGDVDDYVAEIRARVWASGSRLHEYQDNDRRTFAVKNNRMDDGGWVATFEDVSDRRLDEAKIRRLAHNDLLTGLANRPYFLDQLEKAHQRLHDNGQPFTVLMLDLDRFKHVNDSLGHAIGDTLLKQVAGRLEASLRTSDVLARLGGDEFTVIQTATGRFSSLAEAAPVMQESAIALSNRIVDLLGQPFDINGHNVVISASIGIAMAPYDGVEPDELMRKADLALYRTKSEGRNGWSFFNQEMAAGADERRQLEMDMRAGLSRDEFELYYQPQVDVATQSLCGMEALIRWRHPTQGLITPNRFIPLAEDTGLITALGDWILHTGCTEAVRWPPHVKIAINISPVQFRKSNLIDVILCSLVESGLPPERLELEITEQVLLENDPEYLSTLHQLRNIGVSIALDDFGTGYSSLGYLKMFPFDKIKIDRSFAGELLERSDCAAIVCAVINLGRALDIVTIAEGVETQAQFHALHAAGVNQVQGYLFGRPMPAEQIVFDTGGGALAGDTLKRRA
jgi:diguanylate cyclase (GGDEF)-like protein